MVLVGDCTRRGVKKKSSLSREKDPAFKKGALCEYMYKYTYWYTETLFCMLTENLSRLFQYRGLPVSRG